MALADSVPGVSGGTIAFILGFYDNFIGSLHTLFHGNLAEKKTYEAVYENYYKQSLTTDTGIVVKASADVQYSSLLEAKKQIDTMLGKTETGIAARLAEYGASMALYGPHENAYFVPEHRYAWDPNMYEVEGYGGNQWNDGVSSIAEKNVIRVLDGAEANQTKYRKENILVWPINRCRKNFRICTGAESAPVCGRTPTPSPTPTNFLPPCAPSGSV